MIRVFKKFNKLLNKRQKKRIVILLFVMILGAFLEAASVGLMLPLISAIMDTELLETNELAKKFCEFAGIASHQNFVILCLAALIIAFITKNLFMTFQCWVQGKFVFNNRFDVQKRVLKSYMNKPYEFFLNAESGEIIRVLNNDVANSFNMLMTVLSVVSETIVSLTLGVTVFIINPMITIATSVVLVCTMVVIGVLVKPGLKKAGNARQVAQKKSNKWVLQSINGIKEIKISQTEGYFEENFSKYGRELVWAERKNHLYSGLPRMMVEMIAVCSVLGILIVMILFGLSIFELMPALSAFAMAAMRLIPSANRILAGVNMMVFQEPSLNELLKNLDTLERENTRCDTDVTKQEKEKRTKRKLEKEIAVKHLEYAYPGMTKKILDQADMTIPVGKSIGIVGASGNGKTTTVDLILGLLKPQKGQILCDDVDIREDYQGWLTQIGYIPQMIFMLDGSIRENVAFGRMNEDADDARVWKALEEARLADFVRSLPDGLDTGIGERGIRISGGQRQRIGIARALFDDPDILIFDEATSALDNETETAIMESINALHGHKTIIIIAHRLTTIEGCDIVYRVENGKIMREK